MSLATLAAKLRKEAREAEKTYEERFLEALDKYLVDTRKKQDESYEERLAFRPSSYAKCMRQVQYFLKGFPKKGKVIARSRRILEVGTALHEWIQRDIFMDPALEDYGIKLMLAEDLPVYGKEGITFIRGHKAPEMEIKFLDTRYTQKFPISAMIDGAFRFETRDCLFEFKTINTKDFEFMIEPLPAHIKQGALYALCLEIPNVLFLYMDKNTQAFKAFLVTYTPEQLEWVRNRIETIENHTLNDVLLPMEKDFMNCRYCSYSKYCDQNIFTFEEEM